jgi:hypothetical protein
MPENQIEKLVTETLAAVGLKVRALLIFGFHQNNINRTFKILVS